jgi:hypothetical protein
MLKEQEPEMMKKPWLLVGAAALPLLILVGYWLNLLGDPVNETSYGRIRTGMTQRQVGAQVGWVPGEPWFGSEQWPDKPGRAVAWVGDQFTIIVLFDEQGRVTDKASFHWIPTKSWEVQRWDEKLLRFFRLESGPPRWWKRMFADRGTS